MTRLTGAAPTPQDICWELPGYTHGRELGSGAAGRVVLATHDATGAPVAIKYLNGGAGHESLRAEAGLLAGLDSPYVARLYEYIEGACGAAIVMELVDGISLRELLNAEGATAPEAALTVLKGALLGLAAAHAAGVVHRDYKPGNVLVAADGSSKLVDFGIAVRSGDTGQIAGTPAYMAPEQWAGAPASPATDVYAATATFFECLTGAKPYAGTTLIELAVQHTEAAIPDEQAPEALRPLIRHGLAKVPQERPVGAAALVAELEAAARAAYGEDWEERGRHQLCALVALLPLLMPRSGGAADGATALATTRLTPPPPGPRLSRKVKMLSVAAGVVLLAGGLAGVAAASGFTITGRTEVARPKVTTSLGWASPVASASPSGSVSPSVSSSGSLTASPSVSPTVRPSTSITGTMPTTALSPSANPTLSPTATVAPAVLHVTSVAITSAKCNGSKGMDIQVTVTSDGKADGTLTVTWLGGDSEQTLLPVDTFTTITLVKGQTNYSSHFTHTFTTYYFGARVSASPAADRGQNSQSSLSYYTCVPIL